MNKKSKKILRAHMLRNRVFLHSLYSENKSRNAQRINVASKYQCDVLIKILRNLMLNIPMTKEHYEKVRNARKLPFLQKLKDETYFRNLLKDKKEAKVAYLKTFLTLYPVLLFCLFNKK